jgi:hypothetical protein
LIFDKIALKRTVKASDFFFNKECPFSAPFKRPFMTVKALKDRVTKEKNNKMKKKDDNEQNYVFEYFDL